MRYSKQFVCMNYSLIHGTGEVNNLSAYAGCNNIYYTLYFYGLHELCPQLVCITIRPLLHEIEALHIYTCADRGYVISCN